ncbi:MAG: hypothetical protein U0350_11165 [Caldilineaceae bacterium]
MEALSAFDLVQIWEWGQHKHPVDRALGLLLLAQPELQPEQIAALSVGQRNTRLLALRQQTFGATLNGYAECPHCKEKLEFTVAVDAIRQPEPAAQEFDLTVADIDLHCRLPNSVDLAAIVGYSDVQAARCLLVERCIVQAHQAGQPSAVPTLPDWVIPELASAVIAHDPQAEIRFALECPACGQEWSALFDIVSFFWTELGDRVQRLLYDVHLLAQAYGWCEADILNMSAARRQMYLEWVNGQS